MFRRFLLGFAALVLMGWSAPALAELAISDVHIRPGAANAEEIVFDTNGQVTPNKVFALVNPDRAVIDLPLMRDVTLDMPSGYRGTLIRSIRFGRFKKDTSRIVIDLSGPSSIAMTSTTTALTLKIIPLGVAAPTSEVSPFHAVDQGGIVPETKKPLIVIDPGHGGQDPGALGLHKLHEKDVTLHYAKALKEGFLRTGRYRVALTREDDRFIILADRVGIARKIHADYFISLHADSNPNKDATGLSVYSLSETASDVESAALAERENKADVISGVDLNATDADVAHILIDLTQRETMNKSSRWADAIVKNLHAKVTPLTPKTHRFAGFRVLKAPDVPSVLVELGFLSNEVDEDHLVSEEYQSLVVESIINGLDRYRLDEKL